MSTDTSAQRAAFEAWFAESRKSKGPSRRPTFERFEDGTYADDSTQRHWWTWQHAASPQPTAAPVRSMSTDTPAQPLRTAAQAVLDRWDSPKWEWQSHGPTADLMADLRKALAASPQPTAAPVAELVEALNNLLEAVESMQGTYGCVRGDTPEDADTFTHDEWAEKFLQERANAAGAALSRAPGAGMPNA